MVWCGPSEVRWTGDFFLDGDLAAKDTVCRQSAAAPSGLGVVMAFYTWGSRPRLYAVAPSGLAMRGCDPAARDPERTEPRRARADPCAPQQPMRPAPKGR